ncbi:TSN9-like protein [Mya arenaria]|uniref:TSN9-like protein n=1 Tax=Mya arenaria TaxID=6604 RepID=A0ABY7E3G1_MYAAR|nr:TSN9-like protein [Mya arenaria]
MVSKTALKAFMLIISTVLFLCGAIIMGIGIWAVADKIFISDIVGNSLYRSASYIMVVVGACIIMTSFIGCTGAVLNNKGLVFFFVLVNGQMFVLLMTAAILGAVFRDNIEGDLQEDMKRGIRSQYGTSVEYSEENRDITQAWDMLQQRGCFFAAREFVVEQANILLGIGFSFCVFLLTAIVVGVMFILKLGEDSRGSYEY